MESIKHDIKGIMATFQNMVLERLMPRVKTYSLSLKLLKSEDGRKQLKNTLHQIVHNSIVIVREQWKSSIKGKIVIGVCVTAIALVLRSCFCGGEVSVHAFDFTESDFVKSNNTDALFYISKGKDDNLKDVLPNLRRIPHELKEEYLLCESINPLLGVERHKIGWAYYNDEDCPMGYYCVVVHAGDGWVVVESSNKGMHGQFFGYVQTDDEYVEGQHLLPGFYAFVGKQKVPLVTGSTRTMHAYCKIPEKANDLAVDAVRYNRKAMSAAKDENVYRELRRERYQLLPDIIGRLEFKDFKDKVHVPTKLKGLEKCIKPLSDTVELFGETIKIDELRKKAKAVDVAYYDRLLDKNNTHPNNLINAVKSAMFDISVKGIAPYKLCIVNKTIYTTRTVSDVQRERIEYGAELYLYEDSFDFSRANIPREFIKLWQDTYKE